MATAAAIPTRNRISFNANPAAPMVFAEGRQANSFEELGPIKDPEIATKGELDMNNQNRVLLRKGARELNEQEAAQVGGGLRTLTVCSCCIGGKADGDINECGSV
jgi:hypothetical protein